MDDVLRHLIRQVQERLDAGDGLEQAVAGVRGSLGSLGVPETTLERLTEAREWFEESFAYFENLRPPILVGRRSQPDWYPGPVEGDLFWPSLEG